MGTMQIQFGNHNLDWQLSHYVKHSLSEIVIAYDPTSFVL